MVDQGERATEIVADFSSDLLKQGFRAEAVIGALVASACAVAEGQGVESFLLDLLDRSMEKLESS